MFSRAQANSKAFNIVHPFGIVHYGMLFSFGE